MPPTLEARTADRAIACLRKAIEELAAGRPWDAPAMGARAEENALWGVTNHPPHRARRDRQTNNPRVLCHRRSPNYDHHQSPRHLSRQRFAYRRHGWPTRVEMKKLLATIALLCLPSNVLAHDIYSGLRDRNGHLCCGGQDCKPVEAKVLPNGSYIYQQLVKLFLPTWQRHHLMMASTVVLIFQLIQ